MAGLVVVVANSTKLVINQPIISTELDITDLWIRLDCWN